MAVKADKMNNIVLAASLMEQADKECGDAYSNKRKHEHTGRDGDPIETKNQFVFVPVGRVHDGD